MTGKLVWVIGRIVKVDIDGTTLVRFKNWEGETDDVWMQTDDTVPVEPPAQTKSEDGRESAE